jgi:hypothetical protein
MTVLTHGSLRITAQPVFDKLYLKSLHDLQTIEELYFYLQSVEFDPSREPSNEFHSVQEIMNFITRNKIDLFLKMVCTYKNSFYINLLAPKKFERVLNESVTAGSPLIRFFTICCENYGRDCIGIFCSLLDLSEKNTVRFITMYFLREGSYLGERPKIRCFEPIYRSLAEYENCRERIIAFFSGHELLVSGYATPQKLIWENMRVEDVYIWLPLFKKDLFYSFEVENEAQVVLFNTLHANKIFTEEKLFEKFTFSEHLQVPFDASAGGEIQKLQKIVIVNICGQVTKYFEEYNYKVLYCPEGLLSAFKFTLTLEQKMELSTKISNHLVKNPGLHCFEVIKVFAHFISGSNFIQLVNSELFRSCSLARDWFNKMKYSGRYGTHETLEDTVEELSSVRKYCFSTWCDLCYGNLTILEKRAIMKCAICSLDGLIMSNLYSIITEKDPVEARIFEDSLVKYMLLLDRMYWTQVSVHESKSVKIS